MFDPAENSRRAVSRRSFLKVVGGALGLGWAARVLRGGDRPTETVETANASRDSGGDRWLRVHHNADSRQLVRRDVLEAAEPRTTDISPDELLSVVPGSAYAAATETPTERPTEPSTPTPTPTPTPTKQAFTHDQYPLLEGTPYETPLHVIDAEADGPTAFFVGGIHGDERSGQRAARTVASWGIERGTLVVLPEANAPAVERDTREGLHGDLNRNFPTDTQELPTLLARTIWETVVEYDTDWLVDMHSSRGIYQSGDGGVGQAIFPTTIEPAPRYGTSTVEAVNEQFDLSGEMAYDLGGELDGDRPMLAHRVEKFLDMPAFIMETTEKAPLERQVNWHVFSADYTLRLFGQNPIR